MNESDYAIVVGISRYPGLGLAPTGNADLNAPVRDANDIYAWLTSPHGGALPVENVALICSDEAAAAPADVLSAAPKLQEIQYAFQKLVLKAEASDAARQGFRTGRRLYIYMSGHGFAPKPYESCLFVANATRLNVPNVYASGWLQWFQDAACFEEFVLWMDCCMDRMVTVEPEAISLLPQSVVRPRPPTMIAFAATRSLRALETSIEGTIHGVYTYTLLKGLNGAAMDKETRRITGRSIGDYLFNAMKDWIPEAQMNNPLIAKEPLIIAADDDLVFCEVPAEGYVPPSYPITLRFPAAAPPAAPPAQARLWRGSPPVAEELKIEDGVASIQGPRGLYVVEMPGQALRKGFEVTGSGPVDVSIGLSDRGAAVKQAPPGGKCSLDISLGGASEIFILDTDFKLAERGRGGMLTKDMDYGIYKIKTRLGRELHEEIVFLDSDLHIRHDGSPGLSAPLMLAQDGSAADDILSQTHVYIGAGAEILLMVRDDPSLAAPEGALPVYGTKLFDSDRRVLADLDIHGVRLREAAKSFACCRIAVSPGVYFLQRTLSDGVLQEQVIPAIGAFRTELHELRSKLPLTTGEDIAHQQVLVTSDLRAPAADQQRQPEADLVEAATVALADHRKVLSGELYDRLVTNFKDPIAGLLGGHLLLIEAECDPAFKPADGLPALDDVVSRLKVMLGDGQPDVAALSQRCANKDLRWKGPLKYPPLFSRSWKLIVEASNETGNLVPDELWGQVHARLSAAPYFAWATDARSQQAHADGLVAQVLDALKAPSTPAQLRGPVGVPAPQYSCPAPVMRGGSAAGAPAPCADTGELIPRLAKQWSIPATALDGLLAKKAPNAFPSARPWP
jgi:hypothetical protein